MGQRISALGVILGLAGLAFGQATLTLSPLNNETCVAPGNVLVVEVKMATAPTTVVGAQLHLSYGQAALTYLGGAPGDAPFTREIADLTPAPGTILYASGIPDGGVGTAADTVVARLFFYVSTATSVCNVAGVIDFAADVGPYQTKLSDAFGQSVPLTPAPLGSMSFDDTPPTIANCPVPIVTGSDPSVCCFAVVTWTPPTATDDCGAVTVTQTHGAPPGSAFLIGGPYPIQYTAADACGNTAVCNFTVTVVDDDPPTIACPPPVTVPTDAGLCSASGVSLGTPIATDNCGVATVTSDAPSVFLLGTTTVTWTATDSNNLSSTCTQTVTVIDTELPSFSGCPGPLITSADAGTCSAAVSWTPPTANDNCGSPLVTSNYSPGAVFPLGTTTVTYTATDGSGNPAQCSFTVKVNPVSTLVAYVELQPTVEPGPFTRCISFEIWTCPGTAPDFVLEQPVTFANGLSGAVAIEVPCGAYTCIAARDKHHTLRQNIPLAVSGPLFLADFTGDPGSGGHWLIGGNLNDDGVIDAADYAVYQSQYATHFGSPNTTCTTAFPHADVSGDGLVDARDFTFIQINATMSNVGTCCGQPVAAVLTTEPTEAVHKTNAHTGAER